VRKEPISLKNINELIPLGQKVEVYIPEGNFKGTYSSFIYDIDEKFIYLLMPTDERGIKAIIREGDSLYVSFVDKKDRRIGFATYLKEKVNDEDRIIYKIDTPKEDAYSIEFRENFRVDILADAQITYIKADNISKSSGTVIDLSASGAKLSVGIASKLALEVGDRIFISFNLKDIQLKNIEARVVRKIESRADKVNHYGLHFINPDKKLEDKLIKFCISRQLELARRAKGL